MYVKFGGEYRNRTGLHGFAIRCITYLPTRHPAHHLRLQKAKVKGICIHPDLLPDVFWTDRSGFDDRINGLSGRKLHPPCAAPRHAGQ